MGKTFKDSSYAIKSVNKRTKTTRRAKLQPYDRKSFKSISCEQINLQQEIKSNYS